MVKTIDTQTLIRHLKEALEDKKALDVVALDLTAVSDSLDYFVIATGTSQPHLQALERAVREKLHQEDGVRASRVEGPSPRWVLLDYGAVLVHLMSAEAREYYDLEGFWADAKQI
jgi:ribosome-associated protein